MATIDDKVVAMSFEGSKFETGVARALSALAALKKALQLNDAAKNLSNLNAAGKKVDLSSVSKGAEQASGSIGKLGVAAGVVLGGIILKGLQAGAALTKAFTLGPIVEGFREYETQINAVQTILANTASAGTNIKDVNKALDQLNDYADQTIYNFSEMAKNIGTFTAAGVDLQTSVNSIKGIANLAALSGSNSGQAATAMYQLSQAISAGKVSLVDWNSVVNAGMGGTVFQRALAQTAEKMGTLEKGSVALSGSMKNVKINGDSFRESLSGGGIDGESWLTGEVLTTTLEQLSGNLTDAELKAQGYTKAQIEAIQTQAKMALEAATTVKTFSQLVSTTREAMSSGWAKTWRLIFGDFGEAKTLFTAASTAIGGLVQRSSDARNDMLSEWKDLGGRELLIKSLKSAFQSLGAVLGTIKDAFRDIFPKKTGQDLFNLTQGFANFVKSIKPSAETLENLQRTFRGIFAIISIGKQLIGGFLSFLGQIFGAVGKGTGGFLAFTAAMGDLFTRLDKGLKSSNAIGKFFDGFAQLFAKPIEVLVAFAGAIRDLFGNAATKSFDTVAGAIGGVGEAVGLLGSGADKVGSKWDQFIARFSVSDGVFDNLGQSISAFFASIGTFITTGLDNVNLDQVLAVLNTGLFAGIVLALRNFLQPLGNISDVLKHFGGAGLLDNLSGVFGSLSGTLGAVQSNIKANTLKQIAIAMVLLAGAIFILSTIPAEKMNTAMSGLALAFGILLGAMAILNKIAVGPGFLKLPIIAAGLIGLGIAIGILALSVKFFSTFSWEELTKGLLGVSVLLGVVAAAAGPLGKNSLGLIAAGVGIAALGIALNILALAVKQFGNMSWEQLGKGMGAVAAALVVIGGAARLFPPNMVFIGAGLLAVSISLKIMASAISQFAGLSWEEIGKGITVIAGALVAIGLAMKLMPATMVLQASGLILVAFALKTIGKAVEQFAGMSWSEIARGLVAMGGALVVLALGLTAMQGTLTGAAALVVAAVGIRILAGALDRLSGMSWGEIAKGLVALAAAMVVMAAGSVLLAGAAPAMLAMGVALTLIGTGLALAGAGIFLVGLGLAAVSTAGPAAIAVLLTAFESLMSALPVFVKGMIEALLTLVTSLAAAAPDFIEAAVKLITAMAKGIAIAAPAIVDAGKVIISQLLDALFELSPQLVATGLKLIGDLLKGLKANISQFVQTGADIVIKFLQGLAQNAAGIVQAGVNVVLSILAGIGNSIGRIIKAGVTLLAKFLGGIILGLGKVAQTGVQLVVKLISGITNSIGRVVQAGANLIIKFVQGVANAGGRIVNAGVNAAIKFVNAIARGAVRLADEGAKAIIRFLNAVADVIEQREPEMIGAGARIGKAIIMGLVQGLVNFAEQAYSKAREIAEKVADFLKDPLGIFSPSRVTAEIGKNVVLGLANGMDKNASKAYKAAEAMSNGVVSAVKSIFQINSPSKVMFRLGQFVGDGFLEGLKGTQQSIRQAVLNLSSEIAEALRNANDEIAQAKAKLEKLRDAEKPDAKAIAVQERIIAQNKKLVDSLNAANKVLQKDMVKNRADLSKLAKQYATVGEELKAAQEKLDDARKARDDAAASYTEQYSDLPSLLYDPDAKDPENVLGNFKKNLENQGVAVEKFATTLAQLRNIGLSDALYKELVESGVGAQQFATQLLEGGGAAVAEVNAMQARVATASKALGTSAAANLYQAGVDIAKGLVEGLASQLKTIEDQMIVLANKIVSAIRKKLKIKSPSKVMAQVGKQTAQGLAGGLKNSQGLVTGAAESVASEAIDTMRETMANLADILATDLDSTPVISPVVDLSEVQRQSKIMQGIFDGIAPLSSYGQASAIANEQQATADAVEAAGTGTPQMVFEQNNYSPTALTPIEVYRLTKNQLAQAKLATR